MATKGNKCAEHMFEETIIEQCSPTMAGIKTGSLFSCVAHNREELLSSIRRLNTVLVKRSVRLIILKYDGERALLYMYRPDFLGKDLSSGLAREILKERKYPEGTPEYRIAELIKRINNSGEFPHEIGLFLGYPPEDVRGFIDNNAKCAKCSGLWKVYGDANAAQRKFAQYKKCKECYMKSFREHNSIEKLVVAFS